ncbi:MAG TPA: hypothetical protein ENL35_01600 [Chloroflexi bacterium]|nr:hypothetical protein [Chloroflexota bacterium]
MSRPFWMAVALVGLASIAASFGPAEQALGIHVRWVYLHGAWVWTALVAFGAAGLLGLAGLLPRNRRFSAWSVAFGQTGLLFWLSYLPISLWTMQANWNGLYLAEPRFRIGVDFAISGLLLQIAILLLKRPRLSGGLNSAFAASLFYVLLRADQVMHPPSPILTSNSSAIRVFFLGMVVILVMAGLALGVGLHRRQQEA